MALRHEAWGATSHSCGSVSLPAEAAVQQRRSGSWRSAPGVRAPTRWAFAWVALPARCGSGRGSRRSWAQWPLPEPPQHGSIGRVGQQTQGAPGQTGRETVGWPGLSARTEEAMRIQTPPWLVAGPPPRRPPVPAPSADDHPRRTLVAARPVRRPDHDRGSDQPTERFVSGLSAAKCGERPGSLAVGCVGQLTPQHNSSRSR